MPALIAPMFGHHWETRGEPRCSRCHAISYGVGHMPFAAFWCPLFERVHASALPPRNRRRRAYEAQLKKARQVIAVEVSATAWVRFMEMTG